MSPMAGDGGKLKAMVLPHVHAYGALAGSDNWCRRANNKLADKRVQDQAVTYATRRNNELSHNRSDLHLCCARDDKLTDNTTNNKIGHDATLTPDLAALTSLGVNGKPVAGSVSKYDPIHCFDVESA